MDPNSASPWSGLRRGGFLLTLVLLFAVLSLLFYGVYVPGRVLFSGDGPLSRLKSDSHHLPERFTGCWQDLNALGYREPAATLGFSYGLQWLLNPVGFAKFYALAALIILGLSAWYFFRASGLAPPVCVVAALAVALNSTFFSVAAWGVAAHAITIGMTFLALAALTDISSGRRWLRVALAGFAVGMGVTEGADLGAIFSLLVAAFVVYQAWVAPGGRARNVATGIGRVALVAFCAAFISAQAFSELVMNDIINVSVPTEQAQDAQSRWDWATEWSLPKKEILGVVVPGLFGYRMDSPEGGQYWGATGRHPSWDRYAESGGQGPAPIGFLRYSGGGYYAGVFVVLLAAWAGMQAFRKRDPMFNPSDRKLLRFWLAVGLVSVLLGVGRFAPFYRLFYSLPYVSTIRNPIKFLDVFSLALVILFAFGLDGLWRKYMQPAGVRNGQRPPGQAGWWGSIARPERRWLKGCLFLLGASLLAWVVYAAGSASLERYLHAEHFAESAAGSIASFSIRQVGWFELFFVGSIGMLALIFGGTFAGPRALRGMVLVGLLVVLDLGRANLPWVIFWDYRDKYMSNPLVDQLRDQNWQHRVTVLAPASAPQNSHVIRLYKMVWLPDQFPYYDIQTMEISQMPRIPTDLEMFSHAFFPPNQSQTPHLAFLWWQLTNTRYIIGEPSYLESLNNQFDPLGHRFRIASRFRIVPKPGRNQIVEFSDATLTPDPNGEVALIEFTAALPRAKLYSAWQTVTNNNDALALISNESFDAQNSVVVAAGPPAPPPVFTNDPDPGKVEFASYSPKRIVLKCDSPSATILLLNDRFDPNWKASVDDVPTTVLRCNYIMRGVALSRGPHTVEFRFQPPVGPLYLSLAGVGLSIILLGVTAVVGRGNSSRAPVTPPISSAPVKNPAAPQPSASPPALRRKSKKRK